MGAQTAELRARVVGFVTTVVTAVTILAAGSAAAASTPAPGAAGSNAALTCTPATAASAGQDLSAALSGRATKLAALLSRVSRAGADADPDRAQLDAILQAEQTTVDGGGITGLQATAAHLHRCPAIVATFQKMVDDFRVYRLVVPQVDITLGDGKWTALSSTLSGTAAKLATRVAGATHGAAAADQALSAMRDDLTGATQALDSVSIPQLLSQVPADYPGDQALLDADAGAVHQAAAALRAAVTQRKQVKRDLG